jgi:hypothetical protein
MRRLDIDLDAQINNLELEWRLAYDASMVARAEYQGLAAKRATTVEVLDAARDRVERAESKKARIMVRIERLEDSVLGHGG